ncbi:hypothetical protein [Cryptosporangium minutisporangium]|uniref:PknH-like extracellular domain-containing protein n=1 Tax=Cryptosporangium minutisporangium TaxID=113569 RepID=A0ABP6TA92_9ACTN
MFTRSAALAAVTCALALALTGCSNDSDPATEPAADGKASASTSPSPSPSEAPEGRLLTAAEAKAALPAVTDLPGSGWQATPIPPDSGESKVEPASCARLWSETATDHSGYKPKIAAVESTGYGTEATGFTEVFFEVASWTNAADSGLPIEASSAVDECASFTVTDDESTDRMTARKLTPLALGEKQAAIQMSFTVEGTPVYLTWCQFAVGHNLISVAHGSTAAGDPQKTLEPAIRGILTDLEKA